MLIESADPTGHQRAMPRVGAGCAAALGVCMSGLLAPALCDIAGLVAAVACIALPFVALCAWVPHTSTALILTIGCGCLTGAAMIVQAALDAVGVTSSCAAVIAFAPAAGYAAWWVAGAVSAPRAPVVS